MREIYYKNFKKNASKVGKFIDGLIEIPMFTSMKNLAKFILNIIAGPWNSGLDCQAMQECLQFMLKAFSI